MRALVVYAHPCPESFGAAVRDAVLEALREAGHEAHLLDLYAEGFDPVMSADERRLYHEQGANAAAPDVARHLDALRWCEALLLVYPTWWYGPPAILKGWMDRVWVPHETFRMPEPGRPIGRILTNIRLVGAVSTLGSPRWWWWFIGMPGRRMLLTGLRVLCHPRCRTLWLAHHEMDGSTAESRRLFLDRVRARLLRLR